MTTALAETESVWINGLNRTAAAIEGHFKIICTKSTLHHWKSRVPPFPAPNGKNQYNRQQCYEWIETYIIPNRKKDGDDENLQAKAFEAKQKSHILNLEQELFEFEVLKGKYVERSEANRSVAGCARLYHGFVRAEIEQRATETRRAKLIALGVGPEVVAAFLEFDLKEQQGMIERIEARCESEIVAAKV